MHLLVQAIMGSRSRNLHNPNSDLDMRGVYVYPASKYWDIVSPPQEFIKLDGDTMYHEAKRYASLLRNSKTEEAEMLFLPSGSFKGIKAVIPIIAGRDESLPFIILDSDKPGLQTETQLKSSLYQGDKDKIVMLSEICGFAEAEIEDLLPTSLMAHILTRYLRSAEEEFDEVVVSNQPLVPQIEAYAQKHGIELSEGWKVEVAKRVKERMIKQPASIADDDPSVERWKKLFAQLLA